MKKLRYENILDKPSHLKRLTGLDIKDFKKLVSKARAAWHAEVVLPKKLSGALMKYLTWKTIFCSCLSTINFI